MSLHQVNIHYSDYKASSAVASNNRYVIPALRNKNSPSITQKNSRTIKSNTKYVIPALRDKVERTIPRHVKNHRGMPPFFEYNDIPRKYWENRYLLFSKYEQGIQLDKESWYSVTPERIAMNVAERCRCDTIIDGFCGAGGNTIQFAFTCKRVIAIDIDPEKIRLAKINAKVYGVLDKITFICGDFFELVKNKDLVGDVVFMSPPWGGPDYVKSKSTVYDLEQLLPLPFSHLLATAREVSPNVAAFLPRNSDTSALIDEAGSGGTVEIESCFVDDKNMELMVYYNDLGYEE